MSGRHGSAGCGRRGAFGAGRNALGESGHCPKAWLPQAIVPVGNASAKRPQRKDIKT